MPKHQLLIIAGLSTFLTLAIITISMLMLSAAFAASPVQATVTPTPTPVITYVSVSSLGFMPLNADAKYQKDVRRQMLTLGPQATIANNIFVAPLTLPDGNILTGMTVFGEDFDNQGAVEVRLNRCDHSQARCITLAETSSTNTYRAGQFETLKAAIANEAVDNYFYSYVLEAQLNAQDGSGLRSVRLEMMPADTTVPPPPGKVETWSLTGNVTNFLLPNQLYTQAKICTDDLGHLNNITHYPRLVVDRQTIPLSSDMCLTVWGTNIEIRRDLNAGSSSGTYQFLQ